MSRQHLRTKALAVAPLVALVCTIAACSSGGSNSAGGGGSASTVPSGLQAEYAAAKKEPALTWYSGLSPTADQGTISAFEKAYPGLSVSDVRLESGALTTRYASEEAAGAVQAGVLTFEDPVFTAKGFSEGWFAKPTTAQVPNLASWPKEMVLSGGAPVITEDPIGIAYNTNLVKASQVPTKWTQLLETKWQGKLLFDDPRNVPVFLAMADSWRSLYGASYLTGLSKQKLTVVSSVVPGAQQLAAGEGAIIFPIISDPIASLQSSGAPVKWSPIGTTGAIEFSTAVSAKGNKSPDTSYLFLNFLMSQQGQKLLIGTDGHSPLGGGAPLPSGSNFLNLNIPQALQNENEIVTELGLH
jgi:iron(III) transport system substrate-binding protein